MELKYHSKKSLIRMVEQQAQRIAQLERQLSEAPFNADLRSRMNAPLCPIVDPLEDVRLDEYILLGMAGATE